MNENVDRRNLITKAKESVWEIKVGVYSPVLIFHLNGETEIKRWEIKVILN